MIYNFGSINIDQVYRVPHLVAAGETLASLSLDTVLGGKGANQSVALARAGSRVSHIGALGNADRWARDALAEAGVQVDQLRLIDGPSGHAIIQVDPAAENAIVLHGGANQSHDKESLQCALENAKAGDWLVLQNECNALEAAFAIALEREMSIAFNPAPMNDSVLQLPLQRCALLVVNEVEAAQLLGHTVGSHSALELVDLLAVRFPTVRVALTLGSQGAWLIDGVDHHHVDAHQVDAVDTTGAGDTFCGYLIASLAAQLSPIDALRRAGAAAALSVTRPGASPSIPTALEVEDFLVATIGSTS